VVGNQIHYKLVYMTESLKLIDTARFSMQLRRRGIEPNQKRILLTRFSGSKQESDFTIPTNCSGFGRVHHFKRKPLPDWIPNPLPIDPAAKALRLGSLDLIEAQVFQNAICSWRCWYCFVDFELLSGDPRFSEFKTADELIDLYLSETARPNLIDLSGGQPDLVPEWSLWFVESLAKRGLQDAVYLWSDDNLSNDYLWRYLAPNEVDRLAHAPNYGRVGCFKGYDEHSFSFNTKATPDLFPQQFILMRRLVDAGFDVYGYATFTTDDTNHLHAKMANFVDQMQERVHPLFPLRTVPLKILSFTPTLDRVQQPQETALRAQQEALAAWSEELKKRYSPSQLALRITEHDIRGRA
jgi:uncharacterized Fe-S cluster-containing radical SAM superfamily protein